MEAGLLVLTFVILIVSIVKKKYRRSPLLLFSILWFSIIFFYSFRAFGIYSSSNSTLSIYFYGIGSFFLGYILVSPQNKYIIRTSFNHDSYASRKKNLFKYCIIISIVLMFFRSLRAIPFWLAGGAGAVKVAVYGGGGELNGTGFESILFTYFANPMQITCLIYVVISLFQKKKDIIIIILSIILTIFKYIASGGKGIIIMAVVLTFGYLLCNPKIKIRKFLKTHKKMYYSILLSISFVCFMMALKGNFFETAYLYLCGCIPMSDYALTMLVTDMPKFYGLMTFNGLLRILFQVTSFFGFGRGQIDLLNIIFEYYESFQDPIMISPTQKFNAYTSMFTIFFMDGGYVGVIALSLIFGIIAAFSQYRALAKPSYLSIGVLLYVFILIWGSMTRIDFMFVHYAMALVYIFIFFPKNSLESGPLHRHNR